MTGTPSDCLFCRMVAGEIAPDVVRETDRTLAFRDINPQAPTHVLVVPKEHHATFGALAAADPALTAELVTAAHAVAVQEQTVHHVHLHVLGGRGLGWPPG
jgi:histidine triad (HIT) family protein